MYKRQVLPQLLQPVPLTVYQLVSLGRNPYLDFAGRLSQTDRIRDVYKRQSSDIVSEESSADITADFDVSESVVLYPYTFEDSSCLLYTSY